MAVPIGTEDDAMQELGGTSLISDNDQKTPDSKSSVHGKETLNVFGIKISLDQEEADFLRWTPSTKYFAALELSLFLVFFGYGWLYFSRYMEVVDRLGMGIYLIPWLKAIFIWLNVFCELLCSVIVICSFLRHKFIRKWSDVEIAYLMKWFANLKVILLGIWNGIWTSNTCECLMILYPNGETLESMTPHGLRSCYWKPPALGSMAALMLGGDEKFLIAAFLSEMLAHVIPDSFCDGNDLVTRRYQEIQATLTVVFSAAFYALYRQKIRQDRQTFKRKLETQQRCAQLELQIHKAEQLLVVVGRNSKTILSAIENKVSCDMSFNCTMCTVRISDFSSVWCQSGTPGTAAAKLDRFILKLEQLKEELHLGDSTGAAVAGTGSMTVVTGLGDNSEEDNNPCAVVAFAFSAASLAERKNFDLDIAVSTGRAGVAFIRGNNRFQRSIFGPAVEELQLKLNLVSPQERNAVQISQKTWKGCQRVAKNAIAVVDTPSSSGADPEERMNHLCEDQKHRYLVVGLEHQVLKRSLDSRFLNKTGLGKLGKTKESEAQILHRQRSGLLSSGRKLLQLDQLQSLHHQRDLQLQDDTSTIVTVSPLAGERELENGNLKQPPICLREEEVAALDIPNLRFCRLSREGGTKGATKEKRKKSTTSESSLTPSSSQESPRKTTHRDRIVFSTLAVDMTTATTPKESSEESSANDVKKHIINLPVPSPPSSCARKCNEPIFLVPRELVQNQEDLYEMLSGRKQEGLSIGSTSTRAVESSYDDVSIGGDREDDLTTRNKNGLSRPPDPRPPFNATWGQGYRTGFMPWLQKNHRKDRSFLLVIDSLWTVVALCLNIMDDASSVTSLVLTLVRLGIAFLFLAITYLGSSPASQQRSAFRQSCSKVARTLSRIFFAIPIRKKAPLMFSVYITPDFLYAIAQQALLYYIFTCASHKYLLNANFMIPLYGNTVFFFALCGNCPWQQASLYSALTWILVLGDAAPGFAHNCTEEGKLLQDHCISIMINVSFLTTSLFGGIIYAVMMELIRRRRYLYEVIGDVVLQETEIELLVHQRLITLFVPAYLTRHLCARANLMRNHTATTRDHTTESGTMWVQPQQHSSSSRHFAAHLSDCAVMLIKFPSLRARGIGGFPRRASGSFTTAYGDTTLREGAAGSGDDENVSTSSDYSSFLSDSQSSLASRSVQNPRADIVEYAGFSEELDMDLNEDKSGLVARYDLLDKLLEPLNKDLKQRAELRRQFFSSDYRRQKGKTQEQHNHQQQYLFHASSVDAEIFIVDVFGDIVVLSGPLIQEAPPTELTEAQAERTTGLQAPNRIQKLRRRAHRKKNAKLEQQDAVEEDFSAAAGTTDEVSVGLVRLLHRLASPSSLADSGIQENGHHTIIAPPPSCSNRRVPSIANVHILSPNVTAPTANGYSYFSPKSSLLPLHSEVTALLHRSDGLAVVLGGQPPVFSLQGPVMNQALGLLHAAPIGFKGATERFLADLPGGGGYHRHQQQKRSSSASSSAAPLPNDLMARRAKANTAATSESESCHDESRSCEDFRTSSSSSHNQIYDEKESQHRQFFGSSVPWAVKGVGQVRMSCLKLSPADLYE